MTLLLSDPITAPCTDEMADLVYFQQDSSPTKGTILSYFGDNPAAFTQAFTHLGWVVRTEAVA